MYRELEYVERCACNEPAAAGCASCGRARCDFHLTNGLCLRCAEAIRREMAQRSGSRFWVSMALGTAIALALLVVHSAAGILLGIGAAAGAMAWLPRWQRKRLIKQMGPSLAATKGELPPPPRDGDGYPENQSSVPSGAGYV